MRKIIIIIKKSWEKMSINQKKNNIKCVCGVSGLSARWKEYFLLCHPGGMTVWRSSFSCSSHHFATVYGFIAWLLVWWHKMSFMQEIDSHFGTFCILIYIAFIFFFFSETKLPCLLIHMIILKMAVRKKQLPDRNLSFSTKLVNIFLVLVDINQNSE